MGDSESSKVRLAAMNALARREHSRHELERKLGARFPESEEVIARELDRLASQGLQSDERFAEAFCRSRIGRGQGATRIINELKQRGIDPSMARSALEGLDVDWFELAASVARRRFGDSPSPDYKDKGKRVRFLVYRGFSHEQIRYALDGN